MQTIRKSVDDLIYSNDTNEQLKNTSIAIPTRDLKILEILMYRKGISRCEIVRRAIELYINWELNFEEKKDNVAKEYDTVHKYMMENGYSKIRRLE